MKKISEYIKSLGFTFSFRRLRRAFVLIILFAIIGVSVFLFYEFENSESGLKKIYSKEIMKNVDLQGKSIIKVYKRDVNEDKTLDYIFICAEEVRSNDNALNSIVELYKSLDFVILDGKNQEVYTYNTNKDFDANVNLSIVEDEKNRYFLISDYSGNVCCCKISQKDMQNIDEKIIDIVKNTTEKEFLGYTIYTKKDEENPNVINITLDNYSKEYIGAVNEEKKLDFSELGVDISRYRETYLRDKFSEFKFADVNNDGILEFVAYQYVLYNLDETQRSNKTIGKVEIFFNIEDDKLKFNKVNVEI